ncbi:hypothetical protein P8A21_41065 (plasmid) [Streptomyces poriferorum]|uniref:hypothetical protein n=1 Tax=Streptomyces poriferorum TaxID=2798799 RepID=UPI00273DE908|nr:hypothetical protein [Streptomyces sp. Alt1]WLQ53904.1 hypothetical protein P8A21_41065 [Streptomyces sp. Alt1]
MRVPRLVAAVRSFDRGTLRSVGFVCLLVFVFLAVNTSVAQAATAGGADSADLLSPLNIDSSEGVPLKGYELNANAGSIISLKSQMLTFVLGGLFTIVRIVVGLACWAVEFAFRFPLLRMLAGPAQTVSNAYESSVVDTLGLKGLLLGWAFVFGLVTFMRGKVGKGLGEIVLTLVIAAFAASAFVRPDYLLAANGPLAATQQAGADVAQLTANSYSWGGKVTRDPCEAMYGPGEAKCQEREAQKPVAASEVARPIQESVTNALVVKPFMLLQYGRILDPGKKADQKAYAVHLKLISGGYLPGSEDGADKGTKDKDDDPCRLLKGPALKYCLNGSDDEPASAEERDRLPDSVTANDDLADVLTAESSDEDKQFAAALEDFKKAGPVGEACAEYAEKPTWWRVGGVVLVLVAAVLICALLLSAAIVLLGTQAADVAAATVGVVTFVAGMLPGPSRQAVWKWFGLFAVSMLSTFAICMFLPAFGIAMDAILTNGPDLMIERLLLLDALALAALAFQRRLLSGISGFSRRMTLRMRYAKVGGTHMPGDSELSAALAMNTPQGLAPGASSAHQAFGARHTMLGSLAALSEGTPGAGRLLGDAVAEGRRGLAPVALAAQGGRLALRGAHAALIGPRPPEEDESVKLLRVIANGNGTAPGGPGSGPGGGPGGGPTAAMQVNKKTGEILHDPDTDAPLLGPRIHQKASRLRSYRIASRVARVGYGSTLGLPRNAKTGTRKATQFTRDAHTQLRVAANSVREDAGDWASAGRVVRSGVDHASQRAVAAWNVHNPPAAARRAFRSASTGAVIFASPAEPDSGPRLSPRAPDTAVVRPEDPAVDARRRVFDALMRAQRSSWTEPPTWGGGGDSE